MTTHSLETAYTIDTSSIKFGPGVTREVGHEMNQLGARRVMVVTDPRMASSEAVAVTLGVAAGRGDRRGAVRQGERGANGCVVQGGDLICD